MNKIKEVRKVSCYETTDYNARRRDFVTLFVADMEDGSHFYTSVGGSTIYGTEDDIDSGTDIIELHDFYSYDVSGFIWDESAFCIIVEVIAKRLEDGK